MGETKPLTKPQLARLLVVGQGYRNGFRPSFRDQPAVTRQLAAMGHVAPEGGKVASTGRVIHHADAVLTRSGLELLAAAPGEDYEPFRERLRREPPRHGDDA